MKRAFTILVVLVATVTQAHAQTVEAQRFRMSVGPCVLSSGTGAPSAGAGVNCDLYVDTGGDLWMKIAGTWRDLNIGSGTPGTLTKWKTATSLQDTAISESGGAAIVNEAIGSPGYASQVSGWQISTAGAADVRYLFTDELRARLFAADQESVLAGSQRVTKSYSTIAQTFTCPAAGATATLWVNDAATFGDAAVFQANDWIVIHAMTRAAFGPFTIADCVGTVSAYADGSGANAGQQSWTFTRGSGASGGTMTGGTTVAVKQLAQDMGVSGNGYVETTAVDGANGVNAPYMQVVTWATAPTSGNLTTRCRYGNIVGITGLSNEYGFLCGDLTGPGHYVRLSNLVAEIRDIPVNLLDASSNKVIALDPSGPSFAMGNPIPVSYTGANSGLWAGRDSDGVYKLRIGGAAGNRVQWDGTTLSIAGNGSGVTSINGGNIQTGTVTATQIAASTITATQIATNTITANQIASGTITSNQIASNSIHVGSLIATGQGDNVIHNGNFEGVDATSGLAGWFVEGTGQTYTWGCCGTTGPGALLVPQLVNGGNQWISASYYAAPVNAGQTYLLAFDVYSGVATGAGGITIFLNGSKQTTNAYIRYIRSTAGATAPDVTVDTQTVIAQPTLPAGWTHLEYTLTVPSGVTWMAPWFQFTGCYYQVGCSLMALDGVQFTQQLGPGSIKANSITADRLVAGSITSTQIASGTITATQIAAGTITTTQIAASTITGGNIAASTITAGKLSITSLDAITATLGHMSSGTIDTASLSSATITTGNISSLTSTSGCATMNSSGITLSGPTSGACNWYKWSNTSVGLQWDGGAWMTLNAANIQFNAGSNTLAMGGDTTWNASGNWSLTATGGRAIYLDGSGARLYGGNSKFIQIDQNGNLYLKAANTSVGGAARICVDSNGYVYTVSGNFTGNGC